jgi:hypothetical protein
MKPVPNTIPEYAILHPIGARLRWRGPEKVWEEEVITVTAYTRGCSECGDCDGQRYVDEGGHTRCHYRNEKYSYGLRWWERIDI